MHIRRMFGGIAATVGLVLGGVGVTAVAGAIPAAAVPPSSITCSGSPFGVIPPGTYTSLIMPPGALCVTEGTVVVTHGVTMGTASGLAAATGSLTIEGPLTVGTGASFAAFNPAAPTAAPAPVTVFGPVTVEANGFVSTDGPTIAGPVRATDPSALQILDTKIWGPVTINGGGGHNPVNDALGECYSSSSGTNCAPGQYAYNQNFLVSDQIFGWVSITNYDGWWTGIVGNTMGPMIFSDNDTPVGTAIGFNTIYGLAACSDNLPGAPNTGSDVSGPSVVHGPTLGNQRSTCTGVSGGTFFP